jgi:hypothetical protein
VTDQNRVGADIDVEMNGIDQPGWWRVILKAHRRGRGKNAFFVA